MRPARPTSHPRFPGSRSWWLGLCVRFTILLVAVLERGGCLARPARRRPDRAQNFEVGQPGSPWSSKSLDPAVAGALEPWSPGASKRKATGGLRLMALIGPTAGASAAGPFPRSGMARGLQRDPARLRRVPVFSGVRLVSGRLKAKKSRCNPACQGTVRLHALVGPLRVGEVVSWGLVLVVLSKNVGSGPCALGA